MEVRTRIPLCATEGIFGTRRNPGGLARRGGGFSSLRHETGCDGAPLQRFDPDVDRPTRDHNSTVLRAAALTRGCARR